MGFSLSSGLSDAFGSIAENLRGYDQLKKQNADRQRQIEFEGLQKQQIEAAMKSAALQQALQSALRKRPGVDTLGQEEIAALGQGGIQQIGDQSFRTPTFQEQQGLDEIRRKENEDLRRRGILDEMAGSQDPFESTAGRAGLAGIDPFKSKPIADYEHGQDVALANISAKTQRDVAGTYAAGRERSSTEWISDIMGRMISAGHDPRQAFDVISQIQKFSGEQGGSPGGDQTAAAIAELDTALADAKGNFAAVRAEIEADRASGLYNVDQVLQALEQKKRQAIAARLAPKPQPQAPQFPQPPQAQRPY